MPLKRSSSAPPTHSSAMSDLEDAHHPLDQEAVPLDLDKDEGLLVPTPSTSDLEDAAVLGSSPSAPPRPRSFKARSKVKFLSV